MAIRINRAHRDALHVEAVSSFGEVAELFRRGDAAACQAVRPATEAVARLMDEIGWTFLSYEQTYELNMPTWQLAVAADYLADRARAFVLGRRSPSRRSDLMLETVTTALVAAERLLRQTGPPPSGPRLAIGPEESLAVIGRLWPHWRHRLHRVVWADLGSGPSLSELVISDRFGEAAEMRLAREAQWGLLDDLGWPSEDDREQFLLTLPAMRAGIALARIQSFAAGAKTGVEEPERGAEVLAEYEAVENLCGLLLARLPAEVGINVNRIEWWD